MAAWPTGCPAALSLARNLRGLVAREFGERRLEILGLAEIAINRGEAHIGDVDEVAQIGHHGLADGFRGDLALALAFQLTDDLRYHLIDPFRLDRALAQRDLNRAQQLVAVERYAPS